MIWIILTLGLILRLVNLNQSLWIDEATQVILARDSLVNIILQRSADVHPPLSYLLMHFWIMLGTSEIWLRLLSVIFGILTILIVYKFANNIFNKKIALISSLLLAISPYHIYYSQEVRMYSEAIFFASVSMYYFYLLTKKTDLKKSLIYILSTAALIYTHYAGFLLILTQILYIIFYRRESLLFFLKRVLVALLIWLPWFPQFFLQFTGNANADSYLPGWSNILKVSFLKSLPLIFFKFSFGRIDFTDKYFYTLVAVLVLSVFGFVLYQGIKTFHKMDAKLITFWLIIPIVTSILISFVVPFDQPHRLTFVLPAFCIMLALGIYRLQKFEKVLLFLLIIISFSGVGLYYFDTKYWREDWKGAVAFISKKSTENSLSVFAWAEPFPPFIWYGKGQAGLGAVSKFPATRNEVEEKLNNISSKQDIFVFEYLQTLSDPGKVVQAVIEEKGFKKDTIYNFRGVGFIDHYIKK